MPATITLSAARSISVTMSVTLDFVVTDDRARVNPSRTSAAASDARRSARLSSSREFGSTTSERYAPPLASDGHERLGRSPFRHREPPDRRDASGYGGGRSR